MFVETQKKMIQQNVAQLLPSIFQYIQTRQCWYFITIVCKSWKQYSRKCIIGQLEENTYYMAQHAQIALKKGMKHLRFHIATSQFHFLLSLSQLHSLTITCEPSFTDSFWLDSLLQCHYLHVKNLSVERFPPNLKYLHVKYCASNHWFPASLEFLHIRSRSVNILRDTHQMPLLHLQHAVLNIEQKSDEFFVLPKFLKHTKKFELFVPNLALVPDFTNLVDVLDLTLITNQWWSIVAFPSHLQHQLRSLTCRSNKTFIYECCTNLRLLTLVATDIDHKRWIKSIQESLLHQNPHLTPDAILFVSTPPKPKIHYPFCLG